MVIFLVDREIKETGMYGKSNKYVSCPRCKKWNMKGATKCYKCGSEIK
jgi:ribosomal protein L40E